MRAHYWISCWIALAACQITAASPTLQTNVIPVFPDGTTVSIAIGDVNGDGKNELVAVSSQYNAVRIGRVSSDGTWTLLQSIPLGIPSGYPAAQFVSLTIVDMNGDGLKDFVFWGRSNSNKGLLYVLTQTPTGAFVIATYPTPETDADYGMAIADINGDGLPDVITANFGYSSTATLFVLYNAPNTTRFTTYQAIASPSPRILYVYSADLNGDSKMDLFATTHPYGTPGLVVAYNQGTSLGTATILSGPSITETAGFGILNPDGLPDLLTTDGIPNAYTQYISRYHGYAYASPQRLNPGNEPRSPRILDLNGDGVPDLVIDNTLDHTLAVYYGDPVTRQLRSSPFILSGPNLLSTDHGEHGSSDPLTVGDLDNDGLADVVFAVSRIVWIHQLAQAPPVIGTSFNASKIGLNGTSTLSFTITNPDSTTMQAGISFSDTFPSGLLVATPNSLNITGAGCSLNRQCHRRRGIWRCDRCRWHDWTFRLLHGDRESHWR